MFKVYILQSLKDNSFYTGLTENLLQRLKDHNSGSSSYFNTKRPYKLVWYCVFKDKPKAIQFEKYLKNGSGFAFVRKHLV
ncbi:MAG: GIY-YIG nuclease family protein [bacterium]|nr:GIY-YIG nuclease family protein [bacterium]MDZ4205803.1 GIY-YIG nuclease family protein [Patescibacteria group bacterium]